MSVVYPLDTPRYTVAAILAAYGAMTFHAVVDKAKDKHTMGEVRAALIGLRRANLPRICGTQRVWPDGRREPVSTPPAKDAA